MKGGRIDKKQMIFMQRFAAVESDAYGNDKEGEQDKGCSAGRDIGFHNDSF